MGHPPQARACARFRCDRRACWRRRFASGVTCVLVFVTTRNRRLCASPGFPRAQTQPRCAPRRPPSRALPDPSPPLSASVRPRAPPPPSRRAPPTASPAERPASFAKTHAVHARRRRTSGSVHFPTRVASFPRKQTCAPPPGPIGQRASLRCSGADRRGGPFFIYFRGGRRRPHSCGAAVAAAPLVDLPPDIVYVRLRPAVRGFVDAGFVGAPYLAGACRPPGRARRRRRRRARGFL